MLSIIYGILALFSTFLIPYVFLCLKPDKYTLKVVIYTLLWVVSTALFYVTAWKLDEKQKKEKK